MISCDMLIQWSGGGGGDDDDDSEPSWNNNRLLSHKLFLSLLHLLLHLKRQRRYCHYTLRLHVVQWWKCRFTVVLLKKRRSHVILKRVTWRRKKNNGLVNWKKCYVILYHVDYNVIIITLWFHFFTIMFVFMRVSVKNNIEFVCF